jgi:hypothetical protein
LIAEQLESKPTNRNNESIETIKTLSFIYACKYDLGSNLWEEEAEECILTMNRRGKIETLC